MSAISEHLQNTRHAWERRYGSDQARKMMGSAWPSFGAEDSMPASFARRPARDQEEGGSDPKLAKIIAFIRARLSAEDNQRLSQMMQELSGERQASSSGRSGAGSAGRRRRA
jgi:hypothetical protein